MQSSEKNQSVQNSKLDRLNAAMAAYKAAKDAGKVRRVPFGNPSA